MSERTETEYAVWFDTADPNDPGADIRHEGDYIHARYQLDEHNTDYPDDPPRGICRRTLTVIEGDWEVVE